MRNSDDLHGRISNGRLYYKVKDILYIFVSIPCGLFRHRVSKTKNFDSLHIRPRMPTKNQAIWTELCWVYVRVCNDVVHTTEDNIVSANIVPSSHVSQFLSHKIVICTTRVRITTLHTRPLTCATWSDPDLRYRTRYYWLLVCPQPLPRPGCDVFEAWGLLVGVLQNVSYRM